MGKKFAMHAINQQKNCLSHLDAKQTTKFALHVSKPNAKDVKIPKKSIIFIIYHSQHRLF